MYMYTTHVHNNTYAICIDRFVTCTHAFST